MKTRLAIVLAACAAATSAAAQTASFGFNLGTPGVGAQVAIPVGDSVVLRGAVDGLSVSHNEDYSDIAYDGKAKLMTGGAFIDLHPGGGAFFVSGGAYAGKRKIRLHAQPTGSVDIGGQTYTPTQVGRLDGEAKLSSFQPFAGLGFDNTFVGERNWGFRLLAGVSFSKVPKVTLASSGGTLSADAGFQARLRTEEAQARDDAKDFKYFPVLQVGVTRRF